MSLTILGLDPGSRVTGYGLIRADGGRLIHLAHGALVLDAEAPFPARMAELARGVRTLLLEHRPQAVVLERIFLGKNADSAFKLGHARGVLMAEAAQAGADLFEYAARSVKKGVTGRGGAGKEEVQLVVRQLLGLGAISRWDASDALGLACHHAFELQSLSLQRRLKEM